MKLLVDADGCPVIDLCTCAARKAGIELWLFCDTAHDVQREGAHTVIVEKGADSADFALVSAVQPKDTVVTQDYGLAAMCLARGAAVLRHDGLIVDEQNIDALLLARHTARRIRRGGRRLRGPKKRTKHEDDAFAAALSQALIRDCNLQ